MLQSHSIGVKSHWFGSGQIVQPDLVAHLAVGRGDEPMSEFSQTSDETPPPQMAGRVDAVCDRFEKAWQAGQRLRIEDLVANATEPELAVLLRELVALEIEFRLQQGEQPLADEYRARFPSLEPRILQAMIEAVRNNPPPATGRSPGDVPASSGVTPTNRVRCPHCHN